jgi:hypothetical protein
VGARQRESIIVLLHILDGNLPSPHCVTLFAVSPQLASMDIRVAVLATLANV